MIDAQVYGPWAVITGGSEGVGSAFAEDLAKAGMNLVLIARRPEMLAATADRMRSYGVEVRTVELDLLAPNAVDVIRSSTDDLDVGLLILNAGANTHRGEFVDSDPDGVQDVIDLNITVPLQLCRHFGAKLKQRGRGGIILLGSFAGYLGHENISIYCAAKSFGRVFAEGLWLELKPYGVDVLELILGVTRTPAMIRRGLNMDDPGMNVADPADVAREGLAQLGNGPSWVAGGNFEAAKQRSQFPRSEVVQGNADSAKTLLRS